MDDIKDLPDEEIKSYQRIFKKYYDKEISKQETLEQDLRLVNFMRLLVHL